MTAKKVSPKSVRADDAQAALRAPEKASSKKVRAEMGPRYGIVADKAFGVPFGKIKLIAKGIGIDHELALALWETGWYEARLLAAMIDDPARVTAAQMDRWRGDFDNWGVVDTVCFVLFDRTAHAAAKAAAWTKLKDEYGRRAGFALMACVALHRKSESDATFARFLDLIERGAGDERNFVKKGVSWALRAIGQRNAKLKAAALALARRLAASEDAAERWVGKDALKALAKA